MRTKVSLAVSVVVVAITGGVLATSASGQPVVHVVLGPQHDVRVAAFDEHDNGLRLGDRVAGRGPLLDETQSERVGTGYVNCVVHKRIVDPDKGLWNCNYVLELAEGDIVLQGMDPRGPGEYEMAVLGGTGAYEGARGDATFTDVNTDANAYTDIVIRLRG